MWEGKRQWNEEREKLLEPRRWKECEGVKEIESEQEVEIAKMKNREQNLNWLLFEVWHLDGWLKR
jgi:hypothetical protein